MQHWWFHLLFMISLCYIYMFHAVHPLPRNGIQDSQASWEASTPPPMPTPKKLMTNLQQKAFSERFQDRLTTILLRMFPTAACGYVKNMKKIAEYLSHPLNFVSAPVADRNATLKKTVESAHFQHWQFWWQGAMGNLCPLQRMRLPKRGWRMVLCYSKLTLYT